MAKNEDKYVSPLKFNFKNIIILILILVGLYLLVPKLVGLDQTIKLLKNINKGYLLLAITAEVLSYMSAAWLLGIIFSKLGHRINFWTRFKLGSVAAFTIHFVPLGAAGEAAFEYSFLRKQKVESGSIILMWILRFIFNYSGFFFLFLISLILVQTYPKLPFSPKIISPIIFGLVISIITYLVYLYRHKDKFWLVWSKIFNFLNLLLKRFKKNPFNEEKGREIFDDIYQGIGLFSQKKRTSMIALLAGTLYWVGDMTCLFFMFQAFGFTIPIGVLIFGYCVSTILGLLSAIPGGMGVTDGSMVLIYSGLGITSSVALMATLVFRLFSFWIWIPLGFLSYLSLQKVNAKNLNINPR